MGGLVLVSGHPRVTTLSRPGPPPIYTEADDSDLQEGNALEKQLNAAFNFIANCPGKLLETMERMSDHYETNQMTSKVCEHQY